MLFGHKNGENVYPVDANIQVIGEEVTHDLCRKHVVCITALMLLISQIPSGCVDLLSLFSALNAAGLLLQ